MTNATTYTEAIDKIRDEMAASAGDFTIEALGEMMTEYIQANRAAAEAIAAEGKTLAGAISHMRNWAQKNKGKDNCVAVPPQKALELILEYYGAPKSGSDGGAHSPRSQPAVDSLDLDALLGV